MKYIVSTPFFNYNKNGIPKAIKVGTILTQKEFDGLKEPKKAKCEVLQVTPAGRVRYTKEEIAGIVNLYQQNDNVYQVRDQYVAQNPDTLHTPESIRATAGQLRTMDRNYPMDTQWDVKRLVAEVAQEINSDRFGDPQEMKALAIQLRAEAIIAELVA